MLRQKKIFGTLIKLALTAFVVNGCAHIERGEIRPIEGAFCNFYVPAAKAVCADVQTGRRLPDVNWDQMRNWPVMPPETFESILNALSDARRITGQKSVSPQVDTRDVDRAIRHIKRLRGHTVHWR